MRRIISTLATTVSAIAITIGGAGFATAATTSTASVSPQVKWPRVVTASPSPRVFRCATPGATTGVRALKYC
jgi:hypothetical protein